MENPEHVPEPSDERAGAYAGHGPIYDGAPQASDSSYSGTHPASEQPRRALRTKGDPQDAPSSSNHWPSEAEDRSDDYSSMLRGQRFAATSFDDPSTHSFARGHGAEADAGAAAGGAPTLLQEAEECLAQSGLIFLMADLRLLSATGRVYTKFETIAIDSDDVRRNNSADLSGADGSPGRELPACRGVSPAQIMAVLLIELRKEVKAARERHKLAKEEQKLMEGESLQVEAQTNAAPTMLDQIGITRNDSGLFGPGPPVCTSLHESGSDSLLSTWVNPSGRKKFESDMHLSLKAYSEMIGSDLCNSVPNVTHKELIQKMKTHYANEARKKQQEEEAVAAAAAAAAGGEEEGRGEGPASEVDGAGYSDYESTKTTPTRRIRRGLSRKFARGSKGNEDSGHKKPAAVDNSYASEHEDVGDEGNAESNTNANTNTKRSFRFRGRNKKDRPLAVVASASEEQEQEQEEFKEEMDDGGAINASGIESSSSVRYDREDHASSDHDDRMEGGSPGRSFRNRSKQSQSSSKKNRDGAQMKRSKLVQNVQDRVENFREKKAMSEDRANRLKLETMVNDFFNVGTRTDTDFRRSLNAPMSEDELLDFMEKAVQSRIYDKISFMSSFFREGSVSQLMAKSSSRVVWLNDWFPLKDLTYAISIDHEKKRVLVVFRGAITRADWGHIADFSFQKTPNPVAEDYAGRKDHVKIHRGFFLYLFRRRKDIGFSKYDEIASKLEQYTRVIGPEYKVVVTGHSLGGALGTLFAFYASCEKRFTKNAAVKLLTFGSPYVGGYAFADAFRHQERTGKLMYARFHNTRDLVAHGPPNLVWSSRGAALQHVGIDINLPRRQWFHNEMSFLYCKCLKGPQIHYTKRDGGWFRSYGHALQQNFIFHAPLPWRIRTVHALDEHQTRIVHGQKYFRNPLLELSFDQLYDEIVLC